MLVQLAMVQGVKIENGYIVNVNPATGAKRVDEAWSFPWAMWPGAGEPRLLDAALPPNGTELIPLVATPRTPDFKGLPEVRAIAT